MFHIKPRYQIPKFQFARKWKEIPDFPQVANQRNLIRHIFVESGVFLFFIFSAHSKYEQLCLWRFKNSFGGVPWKQMKNGASHDHYYVEECEQFQGTGDTKLRWFTQESSSPNYHCCCVTRRSKEAWIPVCFDVPQIAFQPFQNQIKILILNYKFHFLIIQIIEFICDSLTLGATKSKQFLIITHRGKMDKK